MAKKSGSILHGSRSISAKMVLAIAWLVFSVALTFWWVRFGLRQADRIAELAIQTGSPDAQELAKFHRMLLSEGITLIVLLLVGGIALLYHITREAERSRRLKEFFAAFTHDLKTSLASLRLQAESLEEDLAGSKDEKVLRRLLKDTVRLELQLENSLLLASPEDSDRFFSEPLRLGTVFEALAYHWPELKFQIQGDAVIECDQRALESILKNLMQNSVIHGRASEVRVQTTTLGENAVIVVSDNGKGFKGDFSRLGEVFERHMPTSGSGLGLYLSRRLARQMRGDLKFLEADEGFAVELTLPLAREVRK
mgnify:CR=1 FL=1